MTVAIFSHPSAWLHQMLPGHPESPQRLDAITQELRSSHFAGQLLWLEAETVDSDLLERVHSKNYVLALQERSPSSGLVMVDADTAMNSHTLVAARHAAGAAVQAVDCLLGQKIKRAFCLTRPPGHHAERSAAMGFCFFNNIAIAATRALECGIKRVAVVDFDVHHGNGTEQIFRSDGRVFFASSYQEEVYPNPPYVSEPGHILHMPLPSGSDGDVYRQRVTIELLPALEKFAPEMLFISAGFDAHRADPLAGLNWESEDYAWITQRLCAIADKSGEGRVVSCLEGGYDLTALGESVAAHVGAMLS